MGNTIGVEIIFRRKLANDALGGLQGLAGDRVVLGIVSEGFITGKVKITLGCPDTQNESLLVYRSPEAD